MRTSFTTVAVLFSVILWETSTKPIEIKEIVKRQGIPGQAVLCSFQNQCSTINLPFDGSVVCTDLVDDLSFLFHDVATVTIDDVTCVAFSGVGCTRTNLGGDVALGGTIVIDMTNLNGLDASGFVSSFSCAFV